MIRKQRSEIRRQYGMRVVDRNPSAMVETFFREYTSPAAMAKYSRATAGRGISSPLDHDYKEVYLEALRLLPADIEQGGIRILEFGCGAEMNLLHFGFSVD